MSDVKAQNFQCLTRPFSETNSCDYIFEGKSINNLLLFINLNNF